MLYCDFTATHVAETAEQSKKMKPEHNTKPLPNQEDAETEPPVTDEWSIGIQWLKPRGTAGCGPDWNYVAFS